MKKTLKQTCGIVLSTVMTMGVLAGCGQTEDPVDSSVQSSETKVVESDTTETSELAYEYKTGITITLGGRQGTTDDWQGTDIIAKLEEMFGVTIEATPTPNDVWETKWNLMMAEDNIPDIVTCIDPSLAQVSQWGQDGYLLPINEYLEHMPNLTAFFEAHPEYKEQCTSPDGNIYGLLKYTESPYSCVTRVFIKDEWLDNVGMEYPKTVDELYDVLVAFKEKDANGNGDPNDEIPFAWTENYSRKALTEILQAFDITTQTNTSKCWMILEVNDEGEVYLADTTENYKAFLTFMNKLWEEGLCLDTAYSSSKEEYLALAQANRLGVYSDAAGKSTPEDKTPDLGWEWLCGLTSEYQETPSVTATSQVSDKAKIVLSASTEYPEEVCRLIDYCFSDEGSVNVRKRMDDLYPQIKYDETVIEGYEEFPLLSLSEESKSNPPAGWESWDTYGLQKCYINEAFNVVTRVDEGSAMDAIIRGSHDPELLDNWCKANNTGVIANIAKRMDSVEVSYGYPIVIYDADLLDERNSLVTDLTLYTSNMQAQFITGVVDIETGWDEYIATLNKMGLPRLLEIEQQCYDNTYNK